MTIQSRSITKRWERFVDSQNPPNSSCLWTTGFARLDYQSQPLGTQLLVKNHSVTHLLSLYNNRDLLSRGFFPVSGNCWSQSFASKPAAWHLGPRGHALQVLLRSMNCGLYNSLILRIIISPSQTTVSGNKRKMLEQRDSLLLYY
jgi:hypothetical protein